MRLALHRRVETVVSRARRGWAPEDTWSLDLWLCRVLGEALNHLADNGHTWPGLNSEWPTAEAWERTLHERAEALLAYRPFENETTIAPAQTALRWVAENLGRLSD